MICSRKDYHSAGSLVEQRRNRVRAREPRGLTSDFQRVRVDHTGGWRELDMSEPRTISIDINGFPARVWQKGEGPKLGFLAGFGGLPKWVPFLDALAKERTVVVPSLPGFPGGERGHSVLDSHLDWLLAVRQLLEGAGLAGADLAGSSVGGSLAAEIAAVWAQKGESPARIAPFGLFDDSAPAPAPGAQRPPDVPSLFCSNPANWEMLKAE